MEKSVEKIRVKNFVGRYWGGIGIAVYLEAGKPLLGLACEEVTF